MFRHGKIGRYRDFILAAVVAKGNITCRSCQRSSPQQSGARQARNLSKFLIVCGLSFKKKRGGPANKTDLNWQRPGPCGLAEGRHLD